MKVDFRLELAALDSTDSPSLRMWRNNHDIWRWCRQSDLISDVEQAAWFERQSKDPSIKMYKLVRHCDDTATTVGVCGFTSINMLARHAEFSLYIAPEFHRKGFGKEAMRILLLHGFVNLGFRQIWGEVIDGNHAMKVFEASGFKRDGVRRSFYWKDGKLHDAHLISLTLEEYIEHCTASNSKPSGDPAPSAGDVAPVAKVAGADNHDHGTIDAEAVPVATKGRKTKAQGHQRRKGVADGA